MRSKIRCVTELCNSHYISRFAAFFIVTRPERSTAKRIHKVFLLVCETLKQPLFTLCGTFLRKIIHANTSKFHHLGTNQQGIQKKKKRTERVNCTKTNRRPAYKSHLFCIIYLFAFFFLSKNFVDLPQASKTIKYLRSTSLQRNHIPTQS